MTYDPQQEKNTQGSALGKLLHQYQGDPYFAGLLTSYTNRIQELEDAIWEVIYNRLLENAIGVQLDQIGKLVGRGRNGYSDSDYLIAIRGQIRINRSCGTPEDILAITSLSVGPGYSFALRESYPGSFLLTIRSQVDFNILVLYANTHTARMTGVRMLLVYSTLAQNRLFTFASSVNGGGGYQVGNQPDLDRGLAYSGNMSLGGGRLAAVLIG